ncbi:UDP-N-acetylmuramate--L-alanine ligase [Pontibacter ummariensis]|uniref:UDP-N-acetylmuramate--L-alanine ligase n=1 Tax=Pontibacter ummariensis TaxID=1610492 RepID=A0A239EWA3_9BACT|nr:UDP-N-acetylmuramate--L-alanine ligase [Pontibacter ummariensis]PRY12729.1 UDP-N-acetylmuramate--L-alanine ligase [Pontibacter ummariensis]SNS48568.1 UDP-N-acetylmuramate--L-alanine ligase [Pontibacter ummariensis]
MRLDNYSYIYFLGIGGIGMSAIARWFKAKGYPVWGYDKTRTPLTEALEQEGIEVHYEDNIALLPEEILQHKQQTLVVLTPAIPAEHSEWAYLREQQYMIKKRSEVLGIITASAYTVAVAGTHGKTTTSSMVTHLLHHAGVDCSAFLGGIATNLNSNLLIGKGAVEKEVVVVEADEYDRSFLTLFPEIAIVTSADPDHLDIYGDKEELIRTFQRFISQIKPGGYLFLQEKTDPRLTDLIQAGVHIVKYSLEGGEAHIKNLAIRGRWFEFGVESPFGNIPSLRLGVPGYHNAENALAAVLVAQALKVTEEKIRDGVETFSGVKRRFEFVYEGKGKVYIDDYAHHPKEIDAFMTSLRALYPNKRIKVIFQPHLFSRTRDFADEFAESLSKADELVLLDIYPAREKPIPGVTSEMVLEQVKSPIKELMHKEEVVGNLFKNGDFDVLATVGAGDIDTLVKPLRNFLENN